MRVVLFRDRKNLWRFRLVAANGETVAQSESYVNKADAIETAREVSGVEEYEVLEDAGPH